MNRTRNFIRRNLKELIRDPIIYVFCLGFPVVMMLLFQIIGKYTGGKTPMFELPALLPAIIMFSYTFVMLTLSLLVSKDKQTFFLKRLYASPMKPHNFILGYAFVGLLIGICQNIICVLVGFVISRFTSVNFISIGEILLLLISKLPILIICVFLGISVGSLFTDKSAPGISSVVISLAGILGGCWMPLESMGGFAEFCRFLPFYPSVYIGRFITNSTDSFGLAYTFNNIAKFGLVTIIIYMILSVLLSYISFKKSILRDE